MAKWEIEKKEIRGAERDIVYGCKAFPGATITSEKREIPHANGRPGGWMHTRYIVRDREGNQKERYSLKDAKEYVENVLKDKLITELTFADYVKEETDEQEPSE